MKQAHYCRMTRQSDTLHTIYQWPELEGSSLALGGMISPSSTSAASVSVLEANVYALTSALAHGTSVLKP